MEEFYFINQENILRISNLFFQQDSSRNFIYETKAYPHGEETPENSMGMKNRLAKFKTTIKTGIDNWILKGEKN